MHPDRQKTHKGLTPTEGVRPHRAFSRRGLAGVTLLAFLVAQPAWPIPAFALRGESVSESTGLEGLKDELQIEEIPPVAAGLEGIQERLNQLTHLQGATAKELRQALWKLQVEPDSDPIFWNRPNLLKAIREGKITINTKGLSPVQSPWGEVDLGRLKNLSLYPTEGAAYYIAMDIEIAVVVGLLRVQRVDISKGISPLAVRKALRGQVTPAASISWADALLLRQHAQSLFEKRSLTLGANTFTFQPAQDGQPPLFQMNGDSLLFQQFWKAFIRTLGFPKTEKVFYVLPRSIREAFLWKWPPSNAGLEEETVDGQESIAGSPLVVAAGLEGRRPTNKEDTFGDAAETVRRPEVTVDGFRIPPEGVVFDGLVSEQGVVPPDRVISAGLEVGRKRILVPEAQLQQGIHLFRTQTMELQTGLENAVRTQGGEIINLPAVSEQVPGFWAELAPRAGDVILLSVQAGMEQQWLPADLDLGIGVAVINLPHAVAAGLEGSELAAMVNAALARGGLLRIQAVIQTGMEGILAFDTEA